jgi:hypothetical protein
VERRSRNRADRMPPGQGRWGWGMSARRTGDESSFIHFNAHASGRACIPRDGPLVIRAQDRRAQVGRREEGDDIEQTEMRGDGRGVPWRIASRHGESLSERVCLPYGICAGSRTDNATHCVAVRCRARFPQMRKRQYSLSGPFLRMTPVCSPTGAGFPGGRRRRRIPF